MRPTLLLFLAVLSACATVPRGAYEQAAPTYVPVGPPPASTPGFYPGTPAEPVYTPNGAGLPGERPFGPGPQALPRSPNTRALPDEFSPTREAGLWAADGAESPTAISFVRRLYDVTIPSPKESGDNMTQATVSACLRSLGSAADATGLTPTISSMPVDVRRCLAARALRACVDRGLEAVEHTRRNAQAYDAVETARRRVVAEHARRLADAYCSNVSITEAQDGLNQEVIAEWLRALKEGLTPAR